jgi:hypothetical protein
MLGPQGQIGGKCFRASDCHIWAAIYYLDSPTDYRECLPQAASVVRSDSELVFLDSNPDQDLSKSAFLWLPVCLSMVSGAVLCILVYTSF